MLEFDAGVLGRELPVSFGMLGIAVSLPMRRVGAGGFACRGCDGRDIATRERRVRIPPYRANCHALACNAIRSVRRAVLFCLAEKPRQTAWQYEQGLQIARLFPRQLYRFKELCDKRGELALREISRKKQIVANRVAPEIETQVVAFALEQSAFSHFIGLAGRLRHGKLRLTS